MAMLVAKSGARSSRDPVSLSLPTDASYRYATFQSPRSTQPSTPLRQIHSYALSPRPRSTRGPLTSRYSTYSTPKTPSRPSPPSILITDDLKTLVTEWISALGFSTMVQSRSHYLSDSFRNGVLACELAQVLEKRGIEGIYRPPKSSKEAEKNFAKALQVIGKGKPQSFPAGYFALAGKLGRGSEELIWGLYWSMYNAYPTALPLYLQDVARELPYDSVSIRRLEASLLSWLHSLGVTHDYGYPDNLLDLLPAFRSGVLLYHLTHLLFHSPANDLFLYPVSDSAVLSNIRKSLHILKKVPNMSQKFVWNREKDIQKGNLGVIMGLLEDLCRCVDGLPARKPGLPYHSDGPYCRLIDLKKPGTPLKSALKSSNADGILGQTATWKQANYQYIPKDLGFTLGAELNDLIPGAKSDFPNDIVPIPTPKVSTLEEKCSISAFDLQIHSWFSSLGLSQHTNMTFEGMKLGQLSSGVMLCDLVQTLERVKLSGVSANPKTTAGRRGNLRRALEFLRNKPTFPPELHYIEEPLLSGDGKTWRRLLVQIHHLYRYSGSPERRK